MQHCRIGFAVIPDVGAKAAVVTSLVGIHSHSPYAQRLPSLKHTREGAVAFHSPILMVDRGVRSQSPGELQLLAAIPHYPQVVARL